MTVLRAFKATDTSRSLTETTTNDPDLVVTIATSTTYSVKGLLIFSSASSIDSRIRLNTPSGSITQLTAFGSWGALFDDTHTTDLLDLGANSGGISTWIQGYVRVFGTGGTVGLGWAQSNSNATATTLDAGSWLKVTQIS